MVQEDPGKERGRGGGREGSEVEVDLVRDERLKVFSVKRGEAVGGGKMYLCWWGEEWLAGLFRRRRRVRWGGGEGGCWEDDEVSRAGEAASETFFFFLPVCFHESDFIGLALETARSRADVV